MSEEQIKQIRRNQLKLEVVKTYEPLITDDERYLIVRIENTEEEYCTTESEMRYYGIYLGK